MPRKRYKLFLQGESPSSGSSIPRSTLHRMRNSRGYHREESNEEANGNVQQDFIPSTIDNDEERVMDDFPFIANAVDTDVENSPSGRNISQPVMHNPASDSSESSDNEEDEASFCDNNDQPEPREQLYQNAKITGLQSTSMLFAFALRHGLSDAGVQDLITLINFHVPTSTSIPGSLYLQDKKLNANYSSITKHWYCLVCQTLVGEYEKLCGREACRNTAAEIVHPKDNFFIALDVQDTLQSIFSIEEVQRSLFWHFERRKLPTNSYTCIVDGDAYRKLGLVGEEVTCCVNTDGVNVFKSSQYSVWPILLSINEVRFSIRRKHTFLAGLWFSGAKPNFNTFFKVFVQQNIALRVTGMDWYHNSIRHVSRIMFPMFAGDAPARCQVLCMKQFNGMHGCPWCLIPGESLNGDGPWTYPPCQNVEKRTHSQFLQHILELQQKLQKGEKADFHMGIKGASQLLCFPEFNIVEGSVYDYMHSVPGLLKMFTTAWFDSSNHEENYNIGRKKKEVNDRINSWRFPVESCRTLRDLSDMSYWKASEWKIWMVLVIPILAGILPDPYLKHFAKMTRGVSLLLGDEVSPLQLQESSGLLHEFVNLVPALYNQSFCTFNLHILTHAPECVKNWGPLWGYSLFIFENFNGVLSNSFFGTAKVGQQMAKWMVRAQRVRACVDEFVDDDEARGFYLSLVDNRRLYLKSQKSGTCTFLGKSTKYHFSQPEKRELLKFTIKAEEGLSFEQCLGSGNMFSSMKRVSTKRANCLIEAGKDFYAISALVFIEGFANGLFFVNKLTVGDGILKCGKRVLNSSTTMKIVQSCEVKDSKYYLRFSSDGTQIEYIVSMLNNSELE